MGNYVEVLLVMIAGAAFSAALGFILGVEWSRRRVRRATDDLNRGSDNA